MDLKSLFFYTCFSIVVIILGSLFIMSLLILGDAIKGINPLSILDLILVFVINFLVFTAIWTPEISVVTPFIKWKKRIDGDKVPNDMFNRIFREEDLINYINKLNNKPPQHERRHY